MRRSVESKYIREEVCVYTPGMSRSPWWSWGTSSTTSPSPQEPPDPAFMRGTIPFKNPSESQQFYSARRPLRIGNSVLAKHSSGSSPVSRSSTSALRWTVSYTSGMNPGSGFIPTRWTRRRQRITSSCASKEKRQVCAEHSGGNVLRSIAFGS